jgi:hypothetical protein
VTIEQHLEKMMRQADELDGEMNNAGFHFLGHLATAERARVSLAFAAMVMAYAKDHRLAVKSPVKEITD